MVTKKRGLGRGLDALLPKKAELAPPKTGLEEIPIEFIQPGKYQPRAILPRNPLQSSATR